MHYDAGCNCTQGILLGDYFKSILTGQNLPADLADQAKASPFLRQYNNGRPGGLNNPTLPFEHGPARGVRAAGGRPRRRRRGGTGCATATRSTCRSRIRRASSARSSGRLRLAQAPDPLGRLRAEPGRDPLEPARPDRRPGQRERRRGAVQRRQHAALGAGRRPDRRPPGRPQRAGDLRRPACAALPGQGPGLRDLERAELLARVGRRHDQRRRLRRAAARRATARQGGRPDITIVSGALTPTGFNDPSVAVDDALFLDQMYRYRERAVPPGRRRGRRPRGRLQQPAPGLRRPELAAGAMPHQRRPADRPERLLQEPRLVLLPPHRRPARDRRAEPRRPRRSGSPSTSGARPTRPVPAGYEWTLDLSEDQVATSTSRASR